MEFFRNHFSTILKCVLDFPLSRCTLAAAIKTFYLRFEEINMSAEYVFSQD